VNNHLHQLMPLRLELLKKRWSTFDLPILPFLAPRVFTPWPSRNHYGTQPASEELADVGVYHNQSSQSFSSETKRRSQESPKQYTYKHNPPGPSCEIKHFPPGHANDQRNSPRSTRPNTSDEVACTSTRRGEQQRVEAKGLQYLNLNGTTGFANDDPARKSLLNAEMGHTQMPLGLSKAGKGLSKTAVLCVQQNGRGFPVLSQRTYPRIEARRKRKLVATAQIPISTGKKLSRDPCQTGVLHWSSAKFVVQSPTTQSAFTILYGSWHVRFSNITTGRRPRPFTAGGKRAGHHNGTANVPGASAIRAEIIDMVENTNPISFRQTWADLPHWRASLYWMELMMTALEHYPTKALGLLAATYKKPYPPSYAVSDALDFIIAHYCLYPQDYPLQYLDDLKETVFYILVEGAKAKRLEGRGDQPLLAQHSLWLLMSHLDGRGLKRAYEIMLQTDHQLHENSLIQFSYRFAKDGQTDTAFEVLQRLSRVDFNTTKMLSLCTVVLCRTYRDPNAVYSETRIFEFMISCGMNPNPFIYNVLTWNSINSGDHKTAWQIHGIMEDADILPDAVTYSILLNDAKRRMDAGDIGTVMNIIRQKKLFDPYLVTDVLHAIFLLHQQQARATPHKLSTGSVQSPTSAIRRMLPVYSENFQTEFLARIIPGLSFIETSDTTDLTNLSRTTQLRDSDVTLATPHDGVLTVMITAYLESIKNSESALQFYHHFRKLVNEGDPAVESLTKSTHVWDAILMCFGRFPDLVNECAHIIGDMVTPNERSAQEASMSNPLSDSPPLQSHSTPKPSLYTWSILLKVFMDRGQTVAAEKVLGMMKERGIEPSIITWNTLAHGYVSVQDTDMVADVVSRLEEAEFSVDEVMLSSLKKVHQRKRFLEQLDKKKKMRQVKADLENMVKDKAGLVDEDEWLEGEFAAEDFR
jgi:pentatricopeptide repeat protein